MKNFNFRIGDLELRSSNSGLTSVGEHTIAEIVQWSSNHNEKEFCWTVASWRQTKEGFDLHFVGERPFKTEPVTFWKLAKQGQQLLTEYFDIVEEI